MNMRVVVATVAWILVLTGGTGLAYAQSWGPPAIGRSAEETSPADLMALGSALADKKVELSGLFGTDLGLTIGVDLWFNQWQTGFSFNSDQVGFQNVTQTALGVGVIPNVTLSYRRFFVSASYMWTPDYDFGATRSIVTIPVPLDDGTQFPFPFVLERRIKASRQEVEATFGYRFFETDQGFIAAAVGYKGIFQDYVTAERFALAGDPRNFLTPPERAGKHTETNYNGWFVGFVGGASLGGGVGIFGNAAGGVLYPHCNPSCPDLGVAPYAAAKVGVSYRPFDLPLTFAAGYRVQIINTEVRGLTPRSGNSIDLMHGLVLGANWSF